MVQMRFWSIIRTTTEEENGMLMHNPPHPGEVIREYLGEMNVTAAAKHLGVGRVTLSRVLNGKSAVSPEMAVRLARAFGTSTPEVWLAMQAQYDLWHVQKQNSIRVSIFPHVQHQ
jgi:addiction module HigA family antidote